MSDKRGPARSCTIFSSSHERTLTKERRAYFLDVDEGAAQACERGACAAPARTTSMLPQARASGDDRQGARRPGGSPRSGGPPGFAHMLCSLRASHQDGGDAVAGGGFGCALFASTLNNSTGSRSTAPCLTVTAMPFLPRPRGWCVHDGDSTRTE